MKILIITQVVDSEDLYLGFFHRWIEELANKFEAIEVICLKEGTHAFPHNVRVHSLGKEKGKRPPLVYAFRFLVFAWKLRPNYEAVFVHMNQEYILISGWLWKLLKKKIYLWRNHYAGSWLTDLAVSLSHKVFYTSRHSYTAKYSRAVQMPVGVDTVRFHTDASVERKPNSILFFGRMMPSKRPGLVLDALIELHKRGVSYRATFAGSAPLGEEDFLTALKQRTADAGLSEQVSFVPGVKNVEALKLYQEHQIYVNAGRSGMLDKTIFEAAASGCIVLAASDDWKVVAGEEYYYDGTTDRLAVLLTLFLESTSHAYGHYDVVGDHRLERLVERLVEETTT